MAISKYSQDDKTLYSVYVHIRGRNLFRDLRIEKRRKGLKTLTEAQQVERKLNRQATEQLQKEMIKGLSWKSILEQWKSSHRDSVHGHSSAYIQDALVSINKWTKSWFELPITDIGKAEANDVFKALSSDKKAVSYQKKIKRRISEVFEWAIENRIVPINTSNPVSHLKFSKQNEKMPEILQKGDITRLLREAETLGHEWYPIWFMAVYSGMRTGELQALEVDSLDFNDNLIYVHKNYVAADRRNTETQGFGPTKGRYWREVPMNKPLRNFLLKLLEANNGGFTDPSMPDKRFVLPRSKRWQSGHQAEILRDFCDQIRIPSVCFHTLRACFATHLLRQGVSTMLVMKVAGWKNLETMESYVRLSGIDIKGITDGLTFEEVSKQASSLQDLQVLEAKSDFTGLAA